MPPTNKFPHGLNNWTGTDKPSRTDFVSDNEIIETDAMWKDEYDSSGDVANAGGISEYALAKETYDSDGSVATLGGIQAAIDESISNIGYYSEIGSGQ